MEDGSQRGESKPLEFYYSSARPMAAKIVLSGNVEMDWIGEANACMETLRNIYCLGKLKIGLSLDRPF